MITGKRSLSGRRLFSCDGPECGQTDVPWGKDWLWYGSIKDLEANPETIRVFCSPKCIQAYRTQQVLRNQPPIPVYKGEVVER